MVTVTVTVTVTRPQVISGGCDFKSRYPAVSDADYDSDDPRAASESQPGVGPAKPELWEAHSGSQAPAPLTRRWMCEHPLHVYSSSAF